MKTASNVTTIFEKPEFSQNKAVERQLRVAAYCRVSTDDEEQLTSYEAQQNYYTDKIMTNPKWTMAGIYADEGITGTSARKRPEFLRMIRKCKQKKIDLILVKSISRFARNTVDCLNYIRTLRALGIAVIFEKENINTLEAESEMLITMMGAFAQAESESISQNVRWGMRQAMREGKAPFQYKRLYAYERGEDGKPKIIEEEAKIVRLIYDSYLAGDSTRMIREKIIKMEIPAPNGGKDWSTSTILNILKNEKYCGDVLRQKTFTSDCISGKVQKNKGQLPMYLIRNHHEGIISRDTYNAAQTERARRNSGRAPSRKLAPTGRACYSAKYALTERVICGECGTMYRRCVWNRQGRKIPVWRCSSRIDYGKKYCHSSPTIYEKPLQEAILSAINSAMSQKSDLINQITDAMRAELSTVPGFQMSISDIDQRINNLEQEFRTLFEQSKTEGGYLAHADQFKKINDEVSALKTQRSSLLQTQAKDSATNRRINDATKVLNSGSESITDWDESMIRQLVDTVKVLSETRVRIYLNGGIEIEKELGTERF